jgi:hypothetical protein
MLRLSFGAYDVAKKAPAFAHPHVVPFIPNRPQGSGSHSNGEYFHQ